MQFLLRKLPKSLNSSMLNNPKPVHMLFACNRIADALCYRLWLLIDI